MFERFRSLAYAMTGKPVALPGLWERVGDDFQGCLILVEESLSGLQGRITYVPARMRRFGWKVGDIKWRSISTSAGAAYAAEDLFKELDPDTNQVRNEVYQLAKLYFTAADEFTLVTSQQGGRNSRWQRTAHASATPASGSDA